MGEWLWEEPGIAFALWWISLWGRTRPEHKLMQDGSSARLQGVQPGLCCLTVCGSLNSSCANRIAQYPRNRRVAPLPYPYLRFPMVRGLKSPVHCDGRNTWAFPVPQLKAPFSDNREKWSKSPCACPGTRSVYLFPFSGLASPAARSRSMMRVLPTYGLVS